MASSITIQPTQTTNAGGAFQLQSDGFVAGTILDDWTSRAEIESGQISTSADQPFWGGLPVTLAVRAPGPGGSSSGLGEVLTLSTALANINGWTIFNSSSAGIVTGSSKCPSYASGMSVNFVRPGSLARLVLPINPAAVAGLANAAPNVDLYWDFSFLWLDVSGTGVLPIQLERINTNSKIPDYDSGTGAVNWSIGAVAVVRL